MRWMPGTGWLLIWVEVRDQQARIPWVRLVAAKTRHLSVEAAGYVGAAMAEHVDGSLPWGRFAARPEGRVVAADPETAAAGEAARAAEQFAKRTRSSADGTAGFYVRSTIGVIARIEATVAFVAEALKAFGDTEPAEVRRVKALVVLCNPTQAVELLAALAAMRSCTVDDPLPEPEGAGGDAADAGAGTGLAKLDHHQAPLERMDAFARWIGFPPTRPPRLAGRPHHRQRHRHRQRGCRAAGVPLRLVQAPPHHHPAPARHHRSVRTRPDPMGRRRTGHPTSSCTTICDPCTPS